MRASLRVQKITPRLRSERAAITGAAAALGTQGWLPGGPSREAQIKDWTAAAEKYLRNGIAKAGDPADSAGNPPAWLVSGKTVLANLAIGLGHYEEAVKLLTDPPHSVTSSIAVNDEATRPATGVKSKTFASFVYQTLLRAQIGRHQVNAAIEAMQQLEKIAGASGAEGVTGIYVSLGKEIEKEVSRLIAANDRERLGEVRKSFDKFLEELTRRGQSMSYGSLLWIAETYTGLGEGLSDDAAAAREYFGKAAATYEQLLAKTAADTSPVGVERALGLQLRLANSRRRQGDYEHALESVRAIIAQRPKTLPKCRSPRQPSCRTGARPPAPMPSAGRSKPSADFTIPAAGPSGAGPRSPPRGAFWPGGKADNELRDKYFEARYNIPVCRRQCALVERDPALRAKILDVALGEIRGFALGFDRRQRGCLAASRRTLSANRTRSRAAGDTALPTRSADCRRSNFSPERASRSAACVRKTFGSPGAGRQGSERRRGCEPVALLDRAGVRGGGGRNGRSDRLELSPAEVASKNFAFLRRRRAGQSPVAARAVCRRCGDRPWCP